MKPNPSQTARRRPPPVTLLIGIKCKDAIVMASDSQITAGTSKRLDGSKMETVNFGNFPVLVAQSGSVIHSNRFVDILSKDVVGLTASSASDIRDAAQSAMRKLRLEIRETRFGISADELDLHLMTAGLQVGVMLGFYLNGAPHIVSLDLGTAMAHQSRFFYEADGCGATLGNYLLAELATQKMEFLEAAGLAVYVMEQVKKHDSACGGATKVAVLRNSSGGLSAIGVFGQEGIDKCAAKFAAQEAAAIGTRASEFRAAMMNDSFNLNETLYCDFSFGDPDPTP